MHYTQHRRFNLSLQHFHVCTHLKRQTTDRRQEYGNICFDVFTAICVNDVCSTDDTCAAGYEQHKSEERNRRIIQYTTRIKLNIWTGVMTVNCHSSKPAVRLVISQILQTPRDLK